MTTQQPLKIPWLYLHAINIFTMIVGFSTFLPLGYVTKFFGHRCILYADVKLTSANSTNIDVDVIRSVWGDHCSYTTYISVYATIHAFVWCWFVMFTSSQKDKNNFSTSSSVVMASLCFHGILVFMLFVSSCLITAGTATWCDNLHQEISTIGELDNISCMDSQDITWNIFQTKNKYYSFLLTSKISCWLLTFAVIVQCVLCGHTLFTWYKQNWGAIKPDIQSSYPYEEFDNLAFINDTSRTVIQ